MPTSLLNFALRSYKTAALALFIFVVLSIYWPLRQVPTGSRGVITVGGSIKGIENEGFLLVWPWQRLNIFNVRAEEATTKNAEGSTSDTQPVSTSLVVRYSIVPNKVAEVFEQYSHDGNLDSYIQTATQETFKAVTARYTAPELISKRQQVSTDIAVALRAKVSPYGAQIINIDMTNFSFSPDYMKAINEKVTQEQNALAETNKTATVKAREAQRVVIATAEADATKAKADGEAYALIKVAEAQAKALQVQNDALSKNKDVLELRKIEVQMVQAQKWKGDVPAAMYAGAPIPFVNTGK